MKQIEVLAYAVDAMDELGIRYALVGSYASMAYGEFRMTNDIDILAEIATHQIADICARFLPPDWYVSAMAANEAVTKRRRFNVVHLPTGNKIDFIIPRDNDWSEQQLGRRLPIAILPARSVFAAHPEDIILGKLLYYREGGSDKHLRDIAGMLDISGDQIDRQQVSDWAEELSVRDIWEAIISRVDSGEREQ
ncbi:hypothetical protein SH661x_000350 [Planctomicrobium sp. SH661]|uniref:hypothetical protein n=1 Tax=Planctomicrobium sp. SH661 TaxID=3448124 RepID=UPI003F5C2F4F